MKFISFIINFSFILLLTFISTLLMYYLFYPILYASSLIFPYAIYPFDICVKAPLLWKYLKIAYIVTYIFSSYIFFKSICSIIFKSKVFHKRTLLRNPPVSQTKNTLTLYVGKDDTNNNIFIPEKGLYQNILITGTIGSGKTSSAMYPFAKQLIQYNCSAVSDKLGMLILDVKGNFYKQISEYAQMYNREDDLIVISLDDKVKYNPLDKPHLKPSILANRLKTILTLFSPNTTESYWLDKVEQILSEAIKLCRLYNNGYVTFIELHKLINSKDYYNEKIIYLRKLFQSSNLDVSQVHSLLSSITFFEDEFYSLDIRTSSILKSEITRITNIFISDYEISNVFCPKKEEVNFFGFEDVIKSGKIVVLNMNISEYKNLSKLIAAYLKIDFQTEILLQLKCYSNIRSSVFLCDEFHEYVTSTDADFFAQSREARAINIVATQSYSSLLNTLKEPSSVKVIVQNLINKFWYRTDDSFTIEEAQKQIGKEDKAKISKSISENAQETNYNYFTNSLNSKKSSISESISTYVSSDFIYDSSFFSQKLETFSCLSFISDGNNILPPKKIQMKPYFIENKTSLKAKKYKLISDCSE